MNQMLDLNAEINMTSLEVVELINNFRKLEDNKSELRHRDFMTKTRKELETLEALGLSNERNISLYSYKASNGKTNPCYKLNRYGILTMTMSESTLVRYKIIEYIKALEDKITQLETQKLNNLTNQIAIQEEEITYQSNKVSQVKGSYPSTPPKVRYYSNSLKEQLSELTGRDVMATHRIYKKAQKYLFKQLDIKAWYQVKDNQFMKLVVLIHHLDLKELI